MIWLDQFQDIRLYGSRTLALLIATLLIACDGESRPFEEAVEVQSLGLTGLQISRPFIEQSALFSETDDIVPDEEFLISEGQSVQLGLNSTTNSQLTATLSTEDRSWRSTNSAVVSVTDSGLITGGNDGEADILVSIGGLESAAFRVRVSDAALEVISAIHQVPDDNGTAADTLERCLPGEFFALGTFADGSVRPVYSSDVDYSVSEDTGVFIESTTRETVLINATMPGQAILSAQAASLAAASLPLNVLSTLFSIDVSPNPAGLDEGSQLDFTANGIYTNDEIAATDDPADTPLPVAGRTVNITENVQWLIAAGTEFASVSNGSGSEGRVTGLSDGVASLQASCGDVSSDVVLVNVNETDASDSTELSFDLDDNDGILLLAPGEQFQLEVARGSEFDEDESLSSNELVFAIENFGATDITVSSTGLITAGFGSGSATITVTLEDDDDVSGSLTVTVTIP